MKKKPQNIPEDSKFLEGIGDSAWFNIENGPTDNEFLISRYSLKGLLECKHLFTLKTEGFNIEEDFELTYVSHCTKCNVLQNKRIYTFLKKF